MTGLELLKAPEATAGEIADIISAPCPPTIPAHCDGVSCRECWLTWLTGEPIKEKEPPDKRTAPDDAPAYYWDEKPEQKKVYTFEHGVNILNLRRAGGVWELETVSAPFIKHSHKINLIHPQVSGEVEVSKVVSKTNDSGFIRTYIYF